MVLLQAAGYQTFLVHNEESARPAKISPPGWLFRLMNTASDGKAIYIHMIFGFARADLGRRPNPQTF
jgi:hypothetical protein